MAHFKIFFSISLGIHLLAFSLVSLFPQEVNIDPIRKISIDVALLLPTPEAIAEERIVKKVELPPKERIAVKKEELEKPILKDVLKPEIQSLPREEPAPELPSPPVVAPVVEIVEPLPAAPAVAPVIVAKLAVEKVKPQLQHREEATQRELQREEPRREQPRREQPQEEKPRGEEASPPTIIAQLPSPRIWSDESPILLKAPSAPQENTFTPVTLSRALPSKEVEPLETASPKEPVNVAKTGPSSEETFLAQPRYLQNPRPVYPREARRRGYQGEVLLRVEVIASGEVGQVEVKRSSGHEILDRSALTTVKQWRFVPAQKGANIVSTWVNIPVKFQLE